MGRMQKLLVFVFCVSLAVFVMGCSGSKSGSASSESQSAVSSASSSASSASESTKAPVKVPDLVGMSCDDAVAALESLGLKADPVSDNGKMVLDYSNWMVVEQNPAKDETLDPGKTVKIKVVKGKADGADVEMPDLIGKNCGEAYSDLDFLGLEVDISSDSGKAVIDKTNWTVLEQKPSAGEKVREGSVVELVVTKSEKESAKTDEATEQASDAAAQEPKKQAESVPTEYKTALKKAEQYASVMHMSKQGIYDQLTSEYGEKYSADAAQYAVDNMSADWNANALAKAKEYQEVMSMSPAAIYDQLVSEYGERFTPEEAQYAIDNL